MSPPADRVPAMDLSQKLVRLSVLLALILLANVVPAAATRQPIIDSAAGLGISANPAAVNEATGSGETQLLKQFGVTDDHGVHVGGLWLADCNSLSSGGKKPGAPSCHSGS